MSADHQVVQQRPQQVHQSPALAGGVSKRRCVSSACLACRKRKSKCNGERPSCGACSSVYMTRCVYDPSSDHRRKGVYRKKLDGVRARNDTLEILIKGILTYPEDEVSDLVARIRESNNLDTIASEIEQKGASLPQLHLDQRLSGDNDDNVDDDSSSVVEAPSTTSIERDLAGKFGHLRLENGAFRFLGGTSNLLYLDYESVKSEDSPMIISSFDYTRNEDVIKSWTTVTDDLEVILHLLQLYFTWQYPFHCILSKELFFRDFFRGKPKNPDTQRDYCSSLLVNAIMALGCHFTQWSAARSNPADPSTVGEHFFKEAKRLFVDNEEFETPRLTTVQALALMSLREAGCSHEGRGWVYSGISFRMACELGLHVDLSDDASSTEMTPEDLDARRTTFWGCFFIDKCYSNYLGRQPQLLRESVSTPKIAVIAEDQNDLWSPRGDHGIDKTRQQVSMTKSVALQLSTLAEICSDLLVTFYCPKPLQKPLSQAAEVKRLSDFHTRLEAWHAALPKELAAEEGQLPHILLMHMFFHLLYIHLYRPFLNHTRSTSPLPAKVSPRMICTRAALQISRILRMYKKAYGLKRIPNIAIYIVHSACSIHLLGLPDKNALRDITHGVRSLEEMTDCWPSASRTLATLAIQARRWEIELPEEVSAILSKWEEKYRNDHSLIARARSDTEPIAPQIRIDQIPAPAAVLRSMPQSEQILHGAFHGQHRSSVGASSYPQSAAQHDMQRSGSHSIATSGQPLRPAWTTSSSSALQAGQGQYYPASGSGTPMGASGDINMTFDENKDWWYRDQSSIYENWSRRESSAVEMNNSDLNLAHFGSNGESWQMGQSPSPFGEQRWG